MLLVRAEKVRELNVGAGAPWGDGTEFMALGPLLTYGQRSLGTCGSYGLQKGLTTSLFFLLKVLISSNDLFLKFGRV